MRDEQHVKPSPVWKPISQIKTTELASLEEKNEKMSRLIKELEDSNEGYFRGKELRYDNLAHFYQCVVDPNTNTPNGFIAA